MGVAGAAWVLPAAGDVTDAPSRVTAGKARAPAHGARIR